MTIVAPTSAQVATRQALHQVAEHVLSAVEYTAIGRIRLEPAPGGFQTLPLNDNGRRIAVDGGDIVVIDGGEQRRAPLSTVRAAAEFAGVEPGVKHDLYHISTPFEPDAVLPIDADAAQSIADWFTLGTAALDTLATQIQPDDVPDVVLWPEHFDLGITLDQVNYGVSAGDGAIPDPYLYVGPYGGPPAAEDPYWNVPFGAARTITTIQSTADAVAFFREGREKTAPSA